MAIATFTRQLLRGEELPLLGDGSARRDFTYIDDIVEGVVRAIDRPQGYRTYNLGYGREVAVRDVISLLEELSGRKAKIKFLPAAKGDVSLTLADVSLARRELGYEPRVALREGLKRYLAWLSERRKDSAWSVLKP